MLRHRSKETGPEVEDRLLVEHPSVDVGDEPIPALPHLPGAFAVDGLVGVPEIVIPQSDEEQDEPHPKNEEVPWVGSANEEESNMAWGVSSLVQGIGHIAPVQDSRIAASHERPDVR